MTIELMMVVPKQFYNQEIIIAPTTPVNNNVNKGLSDLLNFRVIIK